MGSDGLYKRDGSPFWWGCYVDPRRGYVRRSTKQRDKRAAGTVLREWERAAAATDSPTHSAPLCNVLSDFRAMKKAQGRAAGTLGMIGQKAAHLARILGNETAVRAIAPRDVDAYVATRQGEGATNHTIDKELGVLVGALKVAARHGLCEAPSTLRPPGFSSGYVPRVAVVASPDDLRALLAVLSPMRAAHVAFIVATSANWGESCRARRADVDLAAGLVRIRGTKNEYRPRAVPIVAGARALLEQALSHAGKDLLFERWQNVRRDLAAACVRAKIPRVSPNDLRRTFGTWLRGAGVEPHLIGAAMGHADSRMVERVYGRIDATDLRAQLVARVGDQCATDVRDERGTPAKTATSETWMRPEIAVIVVPRGGIEPSTRGFSIRGGRWVPVRDSQRRARTGPSGVRKTYAPPTFGAVLDDALSLPLDTAAGAW